MADLLEFNPLRLHYAYFILTSFIGSIIFYTAPSPIHGLQYPDALFMCFSAMTGTGLGVQGTLFVLLILGHAFPIFATISLFRAWMLRSALKDNPDKEKKRQKEKKQMACVEEGTLSTDVIGKAKIANIVTEVQSDISSPCEPEGWNKYGIVVVTDRVHPNQAQDPIDCNEPAEAEYRVIEYKAILLTAVLTMIYFIGFLIIGIMSIGLWSKFIRPDIPREDETSPFWAGAFLATSALCNNGMSLIDTNMSPYQKEPFPLLACGVLILAGNTLFPCLLRLYIWILRKMLLNNPTWQSWRQIFDFALDQSQKISGYLYPAWHTWFLLSTVLFFNAIMWGGFEVAAIRDEEIASLSPNFRVLDGLFQALGISFRSFIDK
ncbi:Cation transporter [Penicillium griseofulvum]|uniref:Cation transporter n=1 Tax=Penicillium patulum TaxID=5078 RepID=A0A135LJ86_PENPA|nr:Cation transporter [Penicillium griseofulvum]KXG48998.1 Cation transporter [Penicillium griseofulvum]